MISRPRSLIEILVEEYDAQAGMKNWAPLPCPYTNQKKLCQGKEKTISEICDAIYETAQSLDGSQTDQQEYFCRETDRYLKGFYQLLHQRAAENQPRTAICFSGGGIRSATFALGLMQGLARRKVSLKQFHFLSTVSGGGYIGSWLSAWIHRQGMDCVQRSLTCSPSELQTLSSAADGDRIAPSTSTGSSSSTSKPASSCADPKRSPVAPEPTTIQHLRRYSNYMSPKLGLLSADTWALVGIFLRNLMLNWLVLLPLLAAALGVPRLAVAVVCWDHPWPQVETAAIILAFLAGTIGVAYQISNLPGWRTQSRVKASWRSEPVFLRWCWMMLNLSAFLSAFYWAWIHIPASRETEQFWWRWAKWLYLHLQVPALHTPVSWLAEKWHSWLPFVLFGLLFHVVGYLIARVVLIKRRRREGMPDKWDLLIRVATGALGGLCLYCGALLFSTPPVQVPPAKQPQTLATAQPTASPSSVTLNVPSLPAKIEVSISPQPAPAIAQPQAEQRAGQQAGLYTTFAAPLFLMVFLIAATIFVGVASTYTNDADREWMARAGGWMLISIFGWSLLAALTIFGPVGLIWLWREFTLSFVSVSGLSGLLTLVGGFSSKTEAKGKEQGAQKQTGQIGQLISASLPLAAAIFAIIILAALALATSLLIAAVNNWLIPSEALPAFSTKNAAWHLIVLYRTPGMLVFAVLLVVGLIGAAMGLFVNINKFSLHSAYRDRLIRAYLGASNMMRHPNPFTGFNEQDNLQMHELPIARFNPTSFREDQLANLAALLIAEPSEEARQNASTDHKARKQACAATLRSRLRHQAPNPIELLETWLRNIEQVSAPKTSTADIKQALSDSFNNLIQSEPLDQEDGFKEICAEEKAQLEKKSNGSSAPLNIAALINNQPDIPLFPFKSLEKFKSRKVYVEKLLINRLLIERAFAEEIVPSPTELNEARPLHIINIALNLVSGKELAWQERKAQPFTVSQLHAGSYNLGYREVKNYAISRQQNGALSLGTSLAISGAAVSPNMGYNSSPPVTFLLSLFNVRLGWWLGNPGVAGSTTYTKPSPFFAPRPLIAETLGMTDSQHPYIYLSDGAHFENLALYEMVRRRCHFILVSDAGADGKFNFDDLGNAIRKIRIDLGVPIRFLRDMPIQPRVKADALFAQKGKDEDKRKYCALATIQYSEVDGNDPKQDGWLLYIKPTVYGNEPSDVQNYAKAHPDFPHETTGDQMYSESQFESYRALGEYVIQQIIDGGGGTQIGQELSLKDLARYASAYLKLEPSDELPPPSKPAVALTPNEPNKQI